MVFFDLFPTFFRMAPAAKYIHAKTQLQKKIPQIFPSMKQFRSWICPWILALELQLSNISSHFTKFWIYLLFYNFILIIWKMIIKKFKICVIFRNCYIICFINYDLLFHNGVIVQTNISLPSFFHHWLAKLCLVNVNNEMNNNKNYLIELKQKKPFIKLLRFYVHFCKLQYFVGICKTHENFFLHFVLFFRVVA